MHRAAFPSTIAMLTMLAALAPHARAQQTPQPSPEIRRITALAGKFDGEAAYTVGGKTVKFTLHHTSHVVAGGFGLAVHEEADVPGLGRYEGENLIGWDSGRRMLHLLTVTNDPYTHDHAGHFTDARHVTLRYAGMQDGRKLVEVIPMEIVSPNEYRFRSTLTVAGQPPQVFEAVMKRIEGLSSR